jgi:predicted MFS family arabinose efflux permease
VDNASGTLTDRSLQNMGRTFPSTAAYAPVLDTCPPIDREAVTPSKMQPKQSSEPTREPEPSLEPQLTTAEPQFPLQPQSDHPGAKSRSLPWHVLHHGEFRRYFIANTLSNFGTWLQNTAQALLAYHLAHSALAVGVVVSAQFSSVLVLGPLAGSVAARARSRRQLLIITQLASATVAAGLAVLYYAGLLTEAGLAVGAFALGMAYCFSLPAFSVLVPALVPEGETRAAMAMNSVSYNIGRAIAPPVAVVIVTTIGFSLVFILNAASFFVLALVLLKLKPQRDLARSRNGNLLAGFGVARRNRSIWLLLAMVAAVTLAADPILVIGPVLARNFGVSSGWAGGFLAFLGIGTVAGSFLPLRVVPERLRDAAYPVFLLGASIIVFALGINLYVCLAMALIAGIACLMAGSVTQTLLLTVAGARQAATVMAVWAVAWAGTKPLASLLDGLLANWLGVQWAGILLALPALLPGAIVVIFPQRLWVKRQSDISVSQEPIRGNSYA